MDRFPVDRIPVECGSTQHPAPGSLPITSGALISKVVPSVPLPLTLRPFEVKVALLIVPATLNPLSSVIVPENVLVPVKLIPDGAGLTIRAPDPINEPEILVMQELIVRLYPFK